MVFHEIISLHGDLHLTIAEARCLPNMVLFSGNLRRCFTALECRQPITFNRGWVHHRRSKINTSDSYVKVCLSGVCVARTRVIPNSQNPVWNENFKIPLAHPGSQVEFEVRDDDIFGAKLIGVATVLAKRIATGEVIDEWFQVKGSSGKPPKPDTAVRLQMVFIPCDKNLIYLRGISENYGLKGSYFPCRRGGKVTLYQDAHVIDGMLPMIMLDDGRIFEHQKCWEDMCHAILEAQCLVYIVGWSIYHKVRLVREPTKPLPNGGDLNLGELLKYKSQEGVRVLLLVWDDPTSHSMFFLKTEGLLQTHDEETREFFKDSSVACVLSPNAKGHAFRTIYTHDQKCVIVDTQDHGSNRKITAFTGSLDLCDGRYDTPEHRLFRDLDTIFQDDYHNPTFHPGKKAPRQPWHDLHCKIEGPAAYDVLTNFEQRWRKAARWSEFEKLLDTTHISCILNDPSVRASKEDDPENWHVQVFRSIDSGSLKGFPKDVHAAEKQNLVPEKNLMVDRSIQMAYIQAIRSAKHFIYIENQYFIGSSFAWASYRKTGFDNLIPIELALKIASKIRAKERFAVYVVIPMWPEGDPTSNVIQHILYWQRQTMQMMYMIIAQAIKSAQLENAHPTDYLNFYCLGNRELHREEPNANGQISFDKDDDLASKKFGRFMIYVHAKGMIVDDEYVILGSANILDRSMLGTGDTEIAMGAYQPHYTWKKKKEHPCGQVYGYRMSLWSEHIGTIEPCFKDPKNLECVKYVNNVAENNWKRYTSDDFTPLQGHILKYPVEIDANGKVNPIPRHEYFPDVGGKVVGSLGLFNIQL